MRHRAYLVGIFIILLCFGLGILSTVISQNDKPTPAPTVRPSPTNDNSRTTLLILGVDRLDNPEPKLMAVWFAINKKPENEVVLFGVPVNFPVSSSKRDTLRDIFVWSTENGVSNDFMIALRNAVPNIHPDYTVIMDEIFFAALVDFIGGVPAGDTFLMGEEAVASQRLISDKPDALLELQAGMLDALRFPVFMFDPNKRKITPLFDMIPQHCVVSEDPRQLVLIASQSKPPDPDGIRIEIMPSSGIFTTPTGQSDQ